MMGSARETPWHGQVKFDPSIRNAFSLTADPSIDTVLAVALEGELGETPGALRNKSKGPTRRDGVFLMKSGPSRVLRPLLSDVAFGPALTLTDSATLVSC